MATTAVFAEIIVVGLQAEAWLTLLVLGLFGTDWVALTSLEKWVALITILAVAAAYMLGVVLDRIADDIFLRCYRIAERRGWRSGGSSHADETGSEVRQLRFAVMDASEGLGKFLDYQRSRLRVARATAVNAVLSLPALAIFLFAQASPSAELIAFLGCAATALIISSVYSAIAINGAWELSLASAFAIVKAKRPAGSHGDESASASSS